MHPKISYSQEKRTVTSRREKERDVCVLGPRILSRFPIRGRGAIIPDALIIVIALFFFLKNNTRNGRRSLILLLLLSWVQMGIHIRVVYTVCLASNRTETKCKKVYLVVELAVLQWTTIAVN